MSGAEPYQHHGSGLLRATAETAEPEWWPDPADEHECRRWLHETWQHAALATAIRQASPSLADRVESILVGEDMPLRDVVRATLAVVRYALRASRRPTPFGTFAGVAPVSVHTAARASWGTHHSPVARSDSRWLHRVIDRLEQHTELLARLEVTFNDLNELRCGRLELAGSSTVSIRETAAVRAVRDEAAVGVPFGVLAEKLAQMFPHAGVATEMLASLVHNGFLRTSLRAPSTVVDPLGYLLARLREAGADSLPVQQTVHELEGIDAKIREHNENPSDPARLTITSRMRALADPVSVPLAVDLRLDAHAQLPRHVAGEMERAAGVLARLARETTGAREWREYFAAFCERYGTGTLVPLRTVVDPDSGIGFPRGYPQSMPSNDRHVHSPRDERLLALITEAIARGRQEIELDDATVAQLAETDSGDPGTFPSHVDMSARVHARSVTELDRGEFTLTLSPGRAAGTLSSRFTPLVPEADLETIFRDLPTTTEGALPAQLSFTPLHASAENVCRVPQSLPDAISVGEQGTGSTIRVDDLAVTASRHRLHLVSLSRRRVVEPEVLHALAPKQQPPLARLLGSLARALDVGWIGFDWGAASRLPFRPRLRYNRAVLSPATWRLTLDDLPADAAAWDAGLESWRACWHCPAHVELREFDQSLPLDLTVPAHRAVLYRHLHRHEDATLVEATPPEADGWLGGHPHTVVLPLTSRQKPAPSPQLDTMPVLTREHGQPPASQHSTWVYAKLFLSPQRMDHLIVHELPSLLGELGNREYWFVRYPQAREGAEAHHLRLRIRQHGDAEHVMSTISAWADRLRAHGMLTHLTFDTYFPETGRYLAIVEAESVFVADSRLVRAQLTHLVDTSVRGTVLAGLSLFDIAAAFLGGRDAAADWLTTQTSSANVDRAELNEVKRLAHGQRQADLPGWAAVTDAHHTWIDAIVGYHGALSETVDADGILHSLLHMHHNRALGVDRERETTCLRLARQAAATWRACHGSNQ